MSALYARIQQERLEDRLAALERAPLAAVDRARARTARRSRAPARVRRPRARSPHAPRRPARPHPDAVDRRDGGDRRRHGRRRPAQGARPLPLDAAAGRARHGRGSPATARPTARPSASSTGWTAATGSSSRCPTGRFRYRVERTRIVPPTAVWVTDRVGYDRLVLSACHPLYSAAKRIVVFARLERATAARTCRRADSGHHPIGPPRDADDGLSMTVLELHHPHRLQAGEPVSAAPIPGTLRAPLCPTQG